jgi:hypothetical protein
MIALPKTKDLTKAIEQVKAEVNIADDLISTQLTSRTHPL